MLLITNISFTMELSKCVVRGPVTQETICSLNTCEDAHARSYSAVNSCPGVYKMNISCFKLSLKLPGIVPGSDIEGLSISELILMFVLSLSPSLPPSPPLSPFAGKGSSSISSDVSSSTDHTPTKAQKNAATSEGRQLVLITQVRPPSRILAVFRRGAPPPHSFCVQQHRSAGNLKTVLPLNSFHLYLWQFLLHLKDMLDGSFLKYILGQISASFFSYCKHNENVT